MRGVKHGFLKNGIPIFLQGELDRGNQVETTGKMVVLAQQILIRYIRQSEIYRTIAKRVLASRLAIAGLILVRQMPGSAKGVMFITIVDESDNANLIVWPSVFANVAARS